MGCVTCYRVGRVQSGMRLACVYGLEAGRSSDIIPLIHNPAKESGAPTPGGHARELGDRAEEERACSLDPSVDEDAGDPDGGGPSFPSRALGPLDVSRHSRLLDA